MKYADVLRGEVEKLEAERAALKAEADTLAVDETRDAAAVDARVDEILARNTAIIADVDAKKARIAELEKLDSERNSIPAAPNFIKPAPEASIADASRMSYQQASDLLARQAEERDIDPTHARKLIKRHRDDLVWVRNLAARSTDAYESAFAKLMTGRSEFLTAEERAAIAVGTNTQGGYLVPTHLDPTLILTNTGTANVVRQLARVVTLTAENTWNGVTTAGSTFSWDAELTEVSDDTPSFGAASIPTYEGHGFIQASMAAFDSIANLSSDILMLFADGRDRLEAVAHCTGAGSTEPTGIFTALDANTNVEVTSTTAATIGVVDLQGLKRALGPRFRGNASWLMAPVYADAIKNLGTALSNAYSTDLTQANTPRLLGLPVYESDDCPTTQTTTVKDNEIVVGDFSNYVIVDKPGSTSIEFIPHLFNTANNLPDGRRGWFMRFRSGADSVNDLAFRLLQDKTSA